MQRGINAKVAQVVDAWFERLFADVSEDEVAGDLTDELNRRIWRAQRFKGEPPR